MKNLALFLLLTGCLYAQQRIPFHRADVSARWVPWSQNGVPMGQWQSITGTLPDPVLNALTYDDTTGVWEIYLARQWDDRRGSWQRREILREGEVIDIDDHGRISVEVQ